MFRQFARDGSLPVAENGGEILQHFGETARGLEEDECAGDGREFGDALAARSGLGRQKAFEEEAIRGQAGDD